jgi:hypothetical protein
MIVDDKRFSKATAQCQQSRGLLPPQFHVCRFVAILNNRRAAQQGLFSDGE